MIRKNILILLMLISASGLIAHAESSQRVAYSGKCYPYFQIIYDNNVLFANRENNSSIFFSKIALYRINLIDLEIERMFAIRNSNSKLFMNNGMVYFTYPRSLINSHSVYGTHSWYTCQVDNQTPKNWILLGENSSDGDKWMRFFQTLDGVYCLTETETSGSYGHCEVSRYHDGAYTVLFTVDNASIIYGHSYLIIETKDRLEKQTMDVYDVQGGRMITVPYTSVYRFPYIVVYGDNLYYTCDKKVFCYDIGTGKVYEMLSSSNQLRLYCDNTTLYVLEYSSVDECTLNIFSADSREYIESFSIPYEFCSPQCIIVDGLVFAGTASGNIVNVYDLSEKAGISITLHD